MGIKQNPCRARPEPELQRDVRGGHGHGRAAVDDGARRASMQLVQLSMGFAGPVAKGVWRLVVPVARCPSRLAG